MPQQTNPVDRRQRREAILEKLSRKELSRDEAERQLLDLDSPLPSEMPPPPAQKNNRGCGCGCGCLTAVVLALALIGLLLLGFFGIRAQSIQHHETIMRNHIEALNR
jgi:uncharacterized protein HemX